MTTQNTNRKTLWETCGNKVTVNLSVGYQPEHISNLITAVVNGKANEYTISGELAGILIDLKKAIEGAYTADENNTVNSYRSCGNVHEDTIFYLSHGKRIAAVKNYRIITGAELKPAVKYVDSVQKEMNQANIITK